MEIKKLDKKPNICADSTVKITEAGNVVEVQFMTRRNFKQTVQMLSGGKEYVELSTGEIKQITHHETRADQEKNLRKTFSKLRGIINANIADVTRCRWITLTYAENMTDTGRLMKDFEKFNKKFQYRHKAEYVVVVEPQGRGAWHIHLLYKFEEKAPFIPNREIAEMWGQGFTVTKKLDENIDNLGAYLTAYLADLDIEQITKNGDELDGEIKEVEYTDPETGEMKSKRYIKGARLRHYPSNMNIYRTSRGITRPIEYLTEYGEASKKVSDGTLTFSSAYEIEDEERGFKNVIINEYYNIKRKKGQ